MDRMKYLLLVVYIFCYCNSSVDSQRSLLHWKRDLELRLESYQNNRNAIHDIIESSINPAREAYPGSASVIGGNVRFTDLVIPTGSLILESHLARPTVRVMLNKTRSYVNSKMNDLDQIRGQLDVIQRQLNDPLQSYIYKGSPNELQPQINRSVITGTRHFKHFMYGHVIQSNRVELKSVNFTDVEQVMRDTYMENPQFAPYDSQNRLFFEGRKTFFNTAFGKNLTSGCCDRLKPLHTNRMMLKSRHQDVLAPILLHSNSHYHESPASIHNLNTTQVHNRQLNLAFANNRFINNTLVMSSTSENMIHLNNLISIRLPMDQPEILKKLVFKSKVQVDEAQLSNSPNDYRLLIGVWPNIQFDLSHENYLLRSYNTRNNSAVYQQVAGTAVLNGDAHFLKGLDSITVNRVPNFKQFVNENVVRMDRPSVVRGPVQFNALPEILDPVEPSRPPHSIPSLRVRQNLDFGSINGMRFPDDVVFHHPHPAAKRPHEVIRIRGPRNFTNSLIMRNFVNVHRLINGIQMPAGVIPIHLNDFMGSVGYSDLVFVDGINTIDVTVQSGQFDELQLRDDVYDDAQNLIVRSVFSRQPDGTDIIRAPLRINNLKIFGKGPRRGLLNGFRPNDVIELARHPVGEGYSSTVAGKKTFLAPVEVTDCVFNDMNDVANWTNHLIRIDRPNTVQTIHTKLAFVQPATYATNAPTPPLNAISSVHIDKLNVEFDTAKNPADYASNWNFSPEFYILHQSLLRGVANQTGGRYRVLNRVTLVQPDGKPGRVNGLALDDIVTLDAPFRFADRFVLVGKVEVMGYLRANRIRSNYPIDAMDLVQFDKYRVPIVGARGPIQLNSLVLAASNQASFVQCHLLNGTPFNEFINTIMSITRPQVVDTNLVFNAPVNLEGLVRTEGPVNGIKRFREFAHKLKTASYSFEDGLQCNTVVIKT